VAAAGLHPAQIPEEFMTRLVALAVSSLVLMACSEAPGEVFDVAANASPNGFGQSGSATYQVEIENLTSGQPMTPALLATHRQPTGLFRVGETAGIGIREIAENGNLGPAMAGLATDKHVADFTVLFGAGPPPVLPGETVTGSIDTDRGAKYLSWASMLICTNDGFTGVDGLRLPAKVGESATHFTSAYDAGSEINTEDFADIVPPCPALTGVPSSDPGTGSSNPALAEGGVIHHHTGIAGGNDLSVAIHGWTNPVARITVTRVN
jgi:hypothetical protein